VLWCPDFAGGVQTDKDGEPVIIPRKQSFFLGRGQAEEWARKMLASACEGSVVKIDEMGWISVCQIEREVECK